jgi:hypothetical protein
MPIKHLDMVDKVSTCLSFSLRWQGFPSYFRQEPLLTVSRFWEVLDEYEAAISKYGVFYTCTLLSMRRTLLDGLRELIEFPLSQEKLFESVLGDSIAQVDDLLTTLRLSARRETPERKDEYDQTCTSLGCRYKPVHSRKSSTGTTTRPTKGPA